MCIRLGRWVGRKSAPWAFWLRVLAFSPSLRLLLLPSLCFSGSARHGDHWPGSCPGPGGRGPSTGFRRGAQCRIGRTSAAAGRLILGMWSRAPSRKGEVPRTCYTPASAPRWGKLGVQHATLWVPWAKALILDGGRTDGKVRCLSGHSANRWYSYS